MRRDLLENRVIGQIFSQQFRVLRRYHIAGSINQQEVGPLAKGNISKYVATQLGFVNVQHDIPQRRAGVVHIIDFTANDNFIVGAVSVDVLQTILWRSGFNIIQQFIKTLGCNIVIAQIVDDCAVIGNDADVFKVCALKRNCDDHFTNTAHNITRKGVPIIDRCDTILYSIRYGDGTYVVAINAKLGRHIIIE